MVLDELRDVAGDRLRLVPFDGPFNFSAKINLGAARSEGEHLLLLNDDMEVVDAGLDRADGHVLERSPGSAPSAAACSGRTAASSTSASRSSGGLPGHIYRGFAGDFSGYANKS